MYLTYISMIDNWKPCTLQKIKSIALYETEITLTDTIKLSMSHVMHITEGQKVGRDTNTGGNVTTAISVHSHARTGRERDVTRTLDLDS